MTLVTIVCKDTYLNPNNNYSTYNIVIHAVVTYLQLYSQQSSANGKILYFELIKSIN